MSQPTAVVRMVTYQRDGVRCIRCGVWSPLTFQHRAATGMGGGGGKPDCVCGVTACGPCNERFEHAGQREALLNGWKVRRWVHRQGRCGDVPVFYPLLGGWHVLRGEGRELVTVAAARVLMVDVYGAKYEEWEQAA